MEQDMSECGLETKKTIRGGDMNDWFKHHCKECAFIWVSPTESQQGVECRKTFKGRSEGGCDHLREQKTKKDGTPDTVKSSCTKARDYEVYVCDKHKRCLPYMKAGNMERVKWQRREESKIYKSCQDCPDYENNNG